MTDHGAPNLTLGDGLYAPCRAQIDIDMKADQFFEWYMKEPVENFMLGTLIVPAILGCEMLEGPEWSKKGSARKIKFTDGSSCLERIVEENFPKSYSYQPWGYDNPVRFISDHAHGTMTVEDVDGITRLTWDYAFHAKNKFGLPLLKLFMVGNWKPHLERALERMKAHLEEHGPEVQMHETAKLDIAA